MSHETREEADARVASYGDLPEYLSVKEVSELLDVDKETVRRWARNGSVASLKVGNTIRIPKRSFLLDLAPIQYVKREEN